MPSFQDLPELLRLKGLELAESQSTYEFLEEDKKTYLATLMSKQEGSQASREMEARATDDWKTYTEGIREARKEMLQHKAEYTALQATFDYERSMNSTKRAEMNRY